MKNEQELRKSLRKKMSSHSLATSPPTMTEEIEGYSAILHHQTHVQAPITHEVLKKRSIKKKERQRKFIEKSNLINIPGLVILYGYILALNKKQPPFIQATDHPLDPYIECEFAMQREHLKKLGRSPKKRRGWGRHNNQTRTKFQSTVDRRVEERINRELTDAEFQNQEPFQTTFIHQLDSPNKS